VRLDSITTIRGGGESLPPFDSLHKENFIMAELYCNPCGGTVNPGGLCPHAKQPNDCPLRKTEAEHKEDLAEEENQ